MRTALVTGSDGFIGRHIHRHLVGDRWDVTGIDIKNGIDCRQAFTAVDRFDLVVHCAAIVGGRATIDNEPLKVATDLAIDSDFFQYVARTKPWRAVYFSSSAAYPVGLQSPDGPRRALTEDMIDLQAPQLPDAVYGWVKLTGERIAAYINADLDNVHVFRPFSGYGHDQDLDYPFPSFIDRAVRRSDPFDIWGSGLQTRDWVHVDDVVNAVMAVLPHQPSSVGPLNIATGRATSFLDLAEMVTAQAGYTPSIRTNPAAPTGVHYRVGVPTALSQFYTPRIDIEEGIDRALRKGHR